jgi:hypothetical protein
MDDDYGDYLYEKRKDAKLDRMHDLMAENQRLMVMLSSWYEAWNDGSTPDGDLLADTLEALQEDSND